METNVELEFINKVKKLSANLRDLANFLEKNQKALEDANVGKGYPFSVSLDDLTFDVSNWSLTLINNYCEKDPNNTFELFDAYYKSLQK